MVPKVLLLLLLLFIIIILIISPKLIKILIIYLQCFNHHFMSKQDLT